MIDFDREMRTLLEEDARHTPPVPEALPALRRTRRRQVLVVAATLVSAVVLVAGAVTGVGALIRSSERHVPANPTESPTPSTAELAPPVVVGSGLDGYVATTFPRVGGRFQDLAVAPDGVVWAAGWESVAGFDGEAWTTYTTEDGLPRGYVYAVEVAADGTAWAGTQQGLARLDGKTWTIVSPAVEIIDVAFAPDGSVVAGFLRPPEDPSWGGVARFDGETWSIVGDVETMPEDFLTFLDVSPVDGAVWVTAGGSGFIPVGTVSRFDGSGWTGWSVNEFPGHEDLPGLIPQAMTVGADGSVWVVMRHRDAVRTEETLARFDGVSWTVFAAPGLRGPLSGLAVHPAWGEMALGPDGAVWIAGNEHLASDEYDGWVFSFDGVSWTRDRVGNEVSAIEVAPDGTLWVVVDGSLVRFTPVHP